MQQPLTALALTVALLAPAAAQAHDIWLARLHGAYHVMHGHAESNTDPYDPESVKDARAYKNGQPLPATIMLNRAQKYASIEADAPGLLSAYRVGGYYVKTKDGKWHNKPKSEMPADAQIDLSLYSAKAASSYLNAREPVTRLGYELEIVPEVNPAKLKKGELLPVRVLFQDKPLADAKVNSNIFDRDSVKVSTDVQGRALVPVARSGFNAVGVAHSVERADKSQADKDSRQYTLGFNAARD